MFWFFVWRRGGIVRLNWSLRDCALGTSFANPIMVGHFGDNIARAERRERNRPLLHLYSHQPQRHTRSLHNRPCQLSRGSASLSPLK